MHTPLDMSSQVKGALILFAAMVSFSASSALAKVASDTVPYAEIIFVRGLVGLAILLPLAWKSRISLAGVRRGLLILRALCGTAAMFLYFYALSSLPVADTMLLNQTTPVFVLPLAALVLKERITWRHAVLVAVALAGVTVVIRPTGDISSIAGGIALISALFAACAYVVVRKLAATDHPITIVFWLTCVTVLASAPVMLPSLVIPDSRTLVILVAVGLVGTLGQLLLTTAYRFGEAGRLAVIGSFGAILGVFWDLMLWGHLPDMWTALGGVTVIAACAAIQVTRASAQKSDAAAD